eukprot:6179534-Pleurochrysis_carterae.AAC.4
MQSPQRSIVSPSVYDEDLTSTSQTSRIDGTSTDPAATVQPPQVAQSSTANQPTASATGPPSRPTFYWPPFWPSWTILVTAEFQPDQFQRADEQVMSRISAGQVVIQGCVLVLDGVQSGFESWSKTLYEFGALRAVPWLAGRYALRRVVVFVNGDKQVYYVKISWISGGYRKSRA